MHAVVVVVAVVLVVAVVVVVVVVVPVVVAVVAAIVVVAAAAAGVVVVAALFLVLPLSLFSCEICYCWLPLFYLSASRYLPASLTLCLSLGVAFRPSLPLDRVDAFLLALLTLL